MDEVVNEALKELTEKAKKLSGENPDNAEILAEITLQQVINYLNREELPAALELTFVQILADVFAAGSAGAGDGIKSISEGDTDITFDTTAGSPFMRYARELQRFRKVFREVTG